MKRSKKLFALAFLCFLAVALALMAGSSLKHRELLESGASGKIRSVAAVTYETGDGQGGELSLPGKLKGLSPRTPVTLFATVQAQAGESLLVKSVFAPLRLYINDTLVYEYGKEGSYPSYMNDPPTGLALVKLPEGGGELSLRVAYQSLTQRSALSVPAFLIGDNAALLGHLFQSEGFSLLFSLILIFLGAAVLLVSLAFVRKLSSGTSFLWLGLFSLSVGLWVLGECDLAAFLIPYPLPSVCHGLCGAVLCGNSASALWAGGIKSGKQAALSCDAVDTLCVGNGGPSAPAHRQHGFYQKPVLVSHHHAAGLSHLCSLPYVGAFRAA